MSGPTLTDVLSTVGTATLSPRYVPVERVDAAVNDIVIYDRLAPEHITTGTIVLGVGLDVAETVALLEYSAQRGALAVVIRGDHDLLETLVATARLHGVALLAMAAGVGWVRMASLLRNAVSTTGGRLGQGAASLSHHDLTAAANSLASAVNGSVLIFNPQQEVLAFSRLRPGDDVLRHQAVIDQHGPAAYREHLRERGIYKKLWSTDQVVSVPAVPEFQAGRRKVVVIRAGDEILGSIWIAEGDTPLAADADEVLRGAAAAASGHLVWLHARAQTERGFSEGLVADLLSGDADVDAAAHWLGVDADRPSAVLLLSVPDPTSHRRVANLAAMHFSAFRHSALTLASRGSVEVVLCDLSADGPGTDAIQDVVTRLARSIDQPVLAALGSTVATLAELPDSHRSAQSVLRVLRRISDGRTRFAAHADVQTEIQLEQLHRLVEEAGDLHDGPARTLLAWDDQHGGELAESLLALLEAFGNVSQAAQRIHVHPNTLRYRVRRACEISGLDLDSPGQRLVAQLHLGARRLSDRT